MTERAVGQPISPERCQEVARDALARYGWALLTPDALAARMRELNAGGVVAEAWPVAVHAYCLELYPACAGLQGDARQQRAFEELHRYLYALSFGERPELPVERRRDLVQEALTRIWERLPHCRKPGAFLAFAAYELRSTLRPLWTNPAPLASLDQAAEVVDTGDNGDPSARAIAADIRRTMRACFDESLVRHPRARQQLEAVWLKFIEGLDDTTIGAYLATSARSVQILRSRGLRLLRAEPWWRKLASELGYAEG
jgi:DNA-directed RNA polymerase specialized sigma24 family protein